MCAQAFARFPKKRGVFSPLFLFGRGYPDIGDGVGIAIRANEQATIEQATIEQATIEQATIMIVAWVKIPVA